MSTHRIVLFFIGMILSHDPVALADATLSTLCPDPNLEETALDCPWAAVTRELTLDAAANRPLAVRFKKLLPDFERQLRADGALKDLKDLWGQSINYDEYAKGIIIHPSILKLLEETFAVPIADRIVHAGLEHTYGYLFSVLKTPFGYKRARWVQGTLESGFSLPEGILGPKTGNGTFFSNITYFTGRIALKDQPLAQKILDVRGARIPKTLRDFPFSSVKPRRLEETVEVGTETHKRTIVLRTDLVPFFQTPTGQKNSHLLIYSISDSDVPGARLITAFPVEPGFAEQVFRPEGLGSGKAVLTRYNAYVEGLTGQQRVGTRKIVDEVRN